MKRYDDLDGDISAAARTLHEEWQSPQLWPDIAVRMKANGSPPDEIFAVRRHVAPWRFVAAAAMLTLALSSMTWMLWRAGVAQPSGQAAAPGQPRLLSDATLAEIERTEEEYIRAIDELARQAAPTLEAGDSATVQNLRERLTAIDEAIVEHRVEVVRNPFNAHLRRQLLWIYQEKRRTLEEVQEHDASSL